MCELNEPFCFVIAEIHQRSPRPGKNSVNPYVWPGWLTNAKQSPKNMYARDLLKALFTGLPTRGIPPLDDQRILDKSWRFLIVSSFSWYVRGSRSAKIHTSIHTFTHLIHHMYMRGGLGRTQFDVTNQPTSIHHHPPSSYTYKNTILYTCNNNILDKQIAYSIYKAYLAF